MKLALTDFLNNRGGEPPVIVNEKAKREAAGLPPKKERVQVRAPQMKKLANAERVADEAIDKLEQLQQEVWNYIDGMADEVITGILDRAKADAERLRNELEAI